jgi:hypothetical protein
MTATPPRRYAVPYFPSREGFAPSGHAFLLARDIQLGVMPIRGSRGRPDFRVELTPPDASRAEWLRHFLHVGQFEPHSVEDAVDDFVETSANYIGYFGQMVSEILVDRDGEPFRLDPLPPGRIIRAPGRYLQIIPKRDRQHLDGRRFASIPRDRIWRLTLPRSLGGARRHRRLIHRLEVLSDPMPRFALQSPDLGHGTGYDFSAYHEACERLQERATRRWGTVPSIQRPVGPTSEYFFIARRLAFLEAQARLREHLLRELNRFLGRIDVPHKIIVSGVPTAEDIAATLERLHDGDVTFAEALDATRI